MESETGRTEAPSELERESAIRAWEREWDGGLLGGPHKRARRVGRPVLVAMGTAAVLAAVVLLRHGGREPPAGGPGDLSIAARKPVPPLKAELAGVREAVVAASQPVSPVSSTADQDPLAAQRQQLALQQAEQERRLRVARLKSAILVPGGQSGAAMSPAGGPNDGGAASGRNGADEGRSPGVGRGATDADSEFARGVSGRGVPVSVATRIEGLTHKVLQGKLIEAVLVPRAISDLPGTVCATVQRDVYGEQGRIVLIPWGSRLCGVYRAELRKGQERLFTVWNMLRRPDGGQVALDSIGADQLGTSGMGGRVDTHFAQTFGVAALVSIIGAGAATAGVGSSDNYNSGAYYRQAVQQAAAQTAQQTLQPYLNMPPTVTVPAGERIRIYVNRDLDFSRIDGESRGTSTDEVGGQSDPAGAWLSVVPSQ